MMRFFFLSLLISSANLAIAGEAGATDSPDKEGKPKCTPERTIDFGPQIPCPKEPEEEEPDGDK